MISSPNRSSRGNSQVRLVVLHTAEGATNVTSLGNFFAKPATQASSHVGIDDNGIEQYVPYSEAAWTVRSANAISDNAELCGFARWTRDEWLDQHRRMLELAAGWIRERCTARGIPIRKLTALQVAGGEAGVIGHVDWTLGMRDGAHVDPGNGFPWDVVIELAVNPQPTTPTAAPPPEDDVLFIRCKPDANTTWWAVLDAPFFVGIASPAEIASAQAAIAAGAKVLDVAPATWTEFDRRSHAVCDNPRPVVSFTPQPAATQKVSPS